MIYKSALARAAGGAFGLLLLLFGAYLIIGLRGRSLGAATGAGFVVVGVYVCLRGVRCAVVVGDQGVTIRGWFRTSTHAATSIKRAYEIEEGARNFKFVRLDLHGRRGRTIGESAGTAGRAADVAALVDAINESTHGG